MSAIMTSLDDKSTCKFISFHSSSDNKPDTKVPIYGYLLFEDECPVEKHTFPLDCKDFIIGREKGSNLRVMTPIASRVHCIISYGEDDDFPILFNKSSLNRTFVNDVLIQTSIRLVDGASIKVGQHEFKFKAIETNSANEDTVACESTLLDNLGDEELEEENGVNLQVKAEEPDENDEIKNEEKVKTRTGRNGRKYAVKNTIGIGKKKVEKKVEKKTEKKSEKKTEKKMEEPLEELSEEPESEQGDKNESENESDAAVPVSASEEKDENEDISAPVSASEEKSENEDASAPVSAAEEKDEDDASVSASATKEKMNDEVASSPLKLRSKNNLKVTFNARKEASKKPQPVDTTTSDAAVRRSSRRRQNAPTSEPVEEEPEEPKKAKTSKKPTGARRKKAAIEEEEPIKEIEEKVVQVENEKPKRGRKPKVQVEEVSDDSAASKPVTRRTRARK